MRLAIREATQKAYIFCMSDHYEQSAQMLETCLRTCGADYRLLEVVSPQHCRVQFIGLFNQQLHVWDVRIRTLADYAQLVKQKNKLSNISLKQFIEIEQDEACLRAQVALKLDEIDAAAIGRTIIMFRKYKRLHLGRHEYGEAVTF